MNGKEITRNPTKEMAGEKMQGKNNAEQKKDGKETTFGSSSWDAMARRNIKPKLASKGVKSGLHKFRRKLSKTSLGNVGTASLEKNRKRRRQLTVLDDQEEEGTSDSDVLSVKRPPWKGCRTASFGQSNAVDAEERAELGSRHVSFNDLNLANGV
jgi:hypothetical protein